MIPKEKAKELFEKFIEPAHYGLPQYTKQCALICVDEVIENVTDTEIIMYEMGGDYYSRPRKSYFQEVKQEIEKL